MVKEYTNCCSRCGKERIVVREWTEIVGMSTVTNIEKRCPDKACQKILDKEIHDKRKKRLDAEANRLKKIKERSTNRKK